jgi:hypothetical protein
MKTRFSKTTLSRLAKVADLDSETRAKILKSVLSLPAHLYPFETIDEIVSACLNKTDEDKGELLGTAIASFLYAVGASAEDPRVMLVDVVERLSADHESSTVEVVSAFLSQLIESSNLLLGAKATALYEDSERLLLESKLVVDVRPVFDQRRVNTIAASTLLYKLRMTFRAPHGGDVETKVFTLRETELKELAKGVERAIEKASIVREAKPFGVMLVESKNDDVSS